MNTEMLMHAWKERLAECETTWKRAERRAKTASPGHWAPTRRV